MAAELDDQYNKRKMPDATNGLGWLSYVGQLNNIRLALQSFWMEALLRDERDKLYRFGEWLEYHFPTNWESIYPSVVSSSPLAAGLRSGRGGFT